jgi:glycosyltransferase involved in cell wall biosynthesis
VPLTVGVDTGSLVGPRTGIGYYTAALLDALEQLDDGPNLVRYVLSLRARLPEGTRRLPFPARWSLRAWAHLDRPSATRVLADVDVVHGTNFIVPPSRVPSVVTVHDCSLVTHPQLVDPVVRLFVPVLRRAIGRGAWVHTPSEHVARQVRELFDTDRVVAVPHGAPMQLDPDPTMAAIAGLEDRPYVLALGRREPRKNHARLVEAFGLLHQEHPDTALLLVGPSGPAQAAVDDAISALAPDAAADVLVTDWLPDAQRNAVLHRAAVLAYPSLDEGFGLPLLEAMAAGVPVVAADCGALPEVAGDAALLVKPDDAPGLAAAMAHAITDRATRDALVARGRVRAGTFSWARTAAAMVELYRRAADAGAGAARS